TCATAQTVALGTNVLGAGQSPCNAYINDEQSNGSCFTGATKTDRWFSFTPAADGNYRFETCGSNYDTIITLFDGCNGGEVACNDNYTTGPATGCNSNRSRIASAALTAGQTYKLRLTTASASFISSTSLMNLSISVAPPAAVNDNCSSASTAILGVNPFDLTEATNDFAASCNTALSRDVWFVYSQPNNGQIKLSTCGGTLNTVLSIIDTCNGFELGCNDNANVTGCTTQSIINNFQMTAGVPIYIRVGTNNVNTFGAGNLTIETVGCDTIDFNGNGVFPEDQDVVDFFFVLAGGACPTGTCQDIDFNNNGVFPEDQDVIDFFNVLAGGQCP
ncbi:MAG TPA: hypothetical protein VK157_10945, partial [Phycisphaerales bacterium]|nr:hypothetical protein [Phycisphaerales bacterium]